MKKFISIVIAMLVVFVVASQSFAAGPYVEIRNGKAVGISKEVLNDGVTNTITARQVKVVPFTAVAVAGVATVTLSAANAFTGQNTYQVFASLQGVTFNANALAVTRFSSTVFRVYTAGLTDKVDGLAIGY